VDDRPLRLIPLGGLGEFGLNALVLEWEGYLLLVDAGLLFANAETPGVDCILPDFAYLSEHRDRLLGILLTHGHEDHIGALPWALEAAPAPVFGSRLTLGLAQRRLRERGVSADLRPLTPGQALDLGPFRIHPIRVAHSVSDSLALAIETPAGVVLHGGDFKLDSTAPPEQRTDIQALSDWGERGVLVLLADSTNAEDPGITGGESDLVPAFEEILERTPGRVLVSCFATSIPRMQSVADVAARTGRPVSFVGRRMTDNARVAMDLGLLRLQETTLTEVAAPGASSSQRSLVFISGSQGEPLSALSMVAIGEHRDIAVAPGDTVVLSARVVPGNERAVSRLMSHLFRRGCDVVHPGTARVHVSGHGRRDDLVELLCRVRPRYLVPIHGEYRMLAQHARLAVKAGMASENVLLAEDGDVLSFVAGEVRREARLPAGRILLDRGADAEIEDLVIRDRHHLSAHGVVVPVVVLDRHSGELQSQPEVLSRGFLDGERGAEILEEAARTLTQSLGARPPEERADLALTRERISLDLKRLFKRRAQKRPLVIPVVMEV
jgi:ribonuclease J